MNISAFSDFLKLGYLILHYGLFSVIAHATAILLYIQISPSLPPITRVIRYFPMIEHSIVSFICVLLGGLLFFYIQKKEQ